MFGDGEQVLRVETLDTVVDGRHNMIREVVVEYS
jgi:hypothetical protein